MLQLVGSGEYRHTAIIQPVTAALEDTLVVGRRGQTDPPRETRRGAAQDKGSDRQPGTALGAAGIDYTTAILGTHTGTKAVGPLALQVTWLVGSLHGASIPAVVLTRVTPGRDERAQRVQFSGP
jgi:hypothetical protein